MPDTAFPLVRFLILLAGLLLASHAHAIPTLHKCVDGHGVASYQSEPCAANRRDVWSMVV